MQTVYNSNLKKLQLEEYNILDWDLDKILKPENNSKHCQQIRRLSDVNSNLKEEPHLNKMQTLYLGNNLSMHLKEGSDKLGINLDNTTTQGNRKGAHKAEITLDENMFKYEEIKTHKQRLYKTALQLTQ